MPNRTVAACAALVSALGIVSCRTKAPASVIPAPYTTWRDYAGSSDSAQYSALKQIDRTNVAQLQQVWSYATGDETIYQFNPVIVDDTMFVLAKNNSVVALDAVTGRERWVHANPAGRITMRGMNYWESADRSERRLFYSLDSILHALDARTGQPAAGFGSTGIIDLREGLDRDPSKISIQSLVPGRVFEDLLILGSATNQEYESAPGDIRAFDVRTGRLVWTFHTVPRPGEFGYETWPPDAWKTVGGANNWSEMSVDTARGIVYIPTASPKYNFYGANRAGENLFGDCLLALDARTGRRLWHFQMVHHDIWDYDNAAAPKLLTVQHDGKPVDIVAQAGKTGFVYVFDRVSGAPLWPIEERPVPQTDMPGETTAPTQPFPTMPKPFGRQSFTEKDLSPFIDDRAERAGFVAALRGARNEGLFTPPGLRNAVQMPGNNGGANVGGAAVDPTKGRLYVLSKDLPSMLRLEVGGAKLSAWTPDNDRLTPPTSTSPSSPAEAEYKSGFGFMMTSSGLSAIAPPWTTLTAYDLNTGATLWERPFGEVPELAAKGVKDTGSHFPKVAPVVTAGGLIFGGARDRKVRALDADTGQELWQADVPAGIEAMPAVYEVNGRQFIVFCVAARSTTRLQATGGHPADTSPVPGSYVAFALPEGR